MVVFDVLTTVQGFESLSVLAALGAFHHLAVAESGQSFHSESYTVKRRSLFAFALDNALYLRRVETL